MALNFPDSPSNGQVFQGFVYNSSKGVWNSTATTASGGGVTSYANLAAFPSSGNTAGDYAFATDTKSLYVWDGAEWDRISTGNNEAPRLTTTPASTLQLEGDGSTSQLVIAAEDAEGFPITYDYDTSPANPNQVTNIAQSGGTFTLTPSTNTAHDGNFTLRLKASDGVSTTSHAVAVTLSFTPANAFKTLYIAHTSGTVREVTGGTSEANATNLNTMITSTAEEGDLILLKPATGSAFGHFKITHSVGTDSFGANPFANRRIAIVGGGLKPNNIFVWDNHDGTTGVRDHPIFSSSFGYDSPTTAPSPTSLSYRQFFFNLTYHRHQTSTNNYENAITRSNYGGATMLNCIVDFNGGRFSWRYDNSNSSTYRKSFKHCTFLNYDSVSSPYSGSSAAVRVIDCAFENSSNRLSNDTTTFGTNQESVNFDSWTYDDYSTQNIETTSAIANGTYGHLKDLNNVTSTNTLFNDYQSAN
tara:strand:+ start:1143 stop:2558 length:1416 start_codon:yes stop_codon:yes gene_type:complete